MPGSTTADFMPIIFWIICGIIAVVFVFGIVSVVANVRRARRAGHNPLTMQTDIATKLLDSDALSSQPSVEARLEKIEQLRAAGTISNNEYDAARARLLTQL
ncbi:SHOCT domain-containing protein [Agreia pratensis]|uniref:Short C-terminal domain-containing protein n=1 Tax=Agreia pratensis TaxID=150121 RepID=A0A1X7IIW4_9MICO|nr:SHOCT domain-containing protein [Agreia pratensis]MBF4633169.1 SHOCT domain-containing protein [Agreia pratensis]SMG14300.1 hypothetical protein SAMN06296010_0532 [Agreia pratensis]